MDIDAIEKIIDYACDGEYIPAQDVSVISDKARDQLAALVANQVKGRCKDCELNTKGICCDGNQVSAEHYCSDFTKREEA